VKHANVLHALLQRCRSHAPGGPRRWPAGLAYIQVNGHAQLDCADMATSLDSREDRPRRQGRTRRRGSRTAKVIALARRLAIPDKDIDCTSVSVSPQYGWVPEAVWPVRRAFKLIGHHVTRGVTLTLRDLSVT